eukprot:360182-Chlamydomonas_euryale.AAC.3
MRARCGREVRREEGEQGGCACGLDAAEGGGGRCHGFGPSHELVKKWGRAMRDRETIQWLTLPTWMLPDRMLPTWMLPTWMLPTWKLPIGCCPSYSQP